MGFPEPAVQQGSLCLSYGRLGRVHQRYRTRQFRFCSRFKKLAERGRERCPAHLPPGLNARLMKVYPYVSRPSRPRVLVDMTTLELSKYVFVMFEQGKDD